MFVENRRQRVQSASRHQLLGQLRSLLVFQQQVPHDVPAPVLSPGSTLPLSGRRRRRAAVAARRRGGVRGDLLAARRDRPPHTGDAGRRRPAAATSRDGHRGGDAGRRPVVRHAAEVAQTAGAAADSNRTDDDVALGTDNDHVADSSR